MNPFLWRGPEFLVFYLALAGAVLIWQAVRKSRRQALAPGQKLNLSDPYEVAFLRSDAAGAIRVAVVRLLDEGVLKETAGGKIRCVVNDLGAPKLAPLEAAVYENCRMERDPQQVPTDWNLRQDLAGIFAAYESRLSAGGFLVGPGLRRQNINDAIYFATFLIAVAGIKIQYALSTGHRNIWFLVLLCAVVAVASVMIGVSGRMTELGSKTIENLKKLAQPAAASGFHTRGGELAMAAALFGFAALPSLAGEQYRRLYNDGSTYYGDSGGSSGSSCGSGGGCGGGGCGGCGS